MAKKESGEASIETGVKETVGQEFGLVLKEHQKMSCASLEGQKNKQTGPWSFREAKMQPHIDASSSNCMEDFYFYFLFYFNSPALRSTFIEAISCNSCKVGGIFIAFYQLLLITTMSLKFPFSSVFFFQL